MLANYGGFETTVDEISRRFAQRGYDCVVFCRAHGNFVGGTNPALLEAMASSPRVLAIERRFGQEVPRETTYFFTVYFTVDNTAASSRSILNCPERSTAMRFRVGSNYKRNSVAESYTCLAEGWPAAYAPVAGKPS